MTMNEYPEYVRFCCATGLVWSYRQWFEMTEDLL